MKFGISARLTLVLALVGLLVSGLTGFYAFNVSRTLLVQSSQDELLLSTQVLARRIALTRQEVSRNLMVLASHPASQASLQADAGSAQTQLATLFKVLMSANPAYLQIRLISAKDYGMERVRVDRDSGTLQVVTGDDLQEKGHFAYVSETLKLAYGETYLSPIAINHEQGSHAGLDRPTLQLATPVSDAQGQALGLLVINLDLDGLFALLSADLPEDFALYLANYQGDYLIHPDNTKTFGFDRGRRVLVQDEFAQTAALVDQTAESVLLQADQGPHAFAPLLAAFVGRTVLASSEETRLILGLARPLEGVLKQTDQLGRTIVQIVILVSLACAFLAVLVARALTHPINSMIAAVHRFSNDNKVLPLPVERSDEIGMLARSFARMQSQIRKQMDDLQDSHEELEHLAQHDMLTELPNRRMFMDRLEQAIARAQRTEEGFALLFIDVDNFKSFNDTLGHAAGDAVLKTVAQRLAANTRKIDTVARLGGDEFVAMIDKFSDRNLISAFTEKLLAALKAPMEFEGHTLCVEFSIGISQFPDDGSTAEEVINNADRAMYRTKAGGRNGYRFTSDANTQPNLL
ncbi:diguanylate cyclase domain-containing protein [Rhodoferax sp.]|uniref:diguanylate cyclase domain-containing protein n=1 Tax=Rhodoferax sp. TaxID=50421 RepID=UPI002ACE8A36|nr:diguanylate cyclase [Rhodoferax sp.]MDZ7920605.1 diguanylate cyclase [Rhodoferax sp.]